MTSIPDYHSKDACEHVGDDFHTHTGGKYRMYSWPAKMIPVNLKKNS